MQKEINLKNAQLLMILGSTVYKAWPQQAEAALMCVYSAPQEMQESLMETLVRHFGDEDLHKSDEFSGVMIMPEFYANEIMKDLRKQGGVFEKAEQLMGRKLPVQEFAKEFLALLKSLTNMHQQAVLMTICRNAGFLPYNYAQIDAGISEEDWNRIVNKDKEVIRQIDEIALEKGAKYHHFTDRAMALLELIDKGDPDKDTRIVRLALALHGSRKKVEATIMIGSPIPLSEAGEGGPLGELLGRILRNGRP
ncbi:MAG: hypothetical protein UY41_C0041G0002 [Candidatus Moranbacteria bacterium GW2011_GWE1_49_15]|nr:MAG: hypothetical protein UX75_C0022G0008 [Candidatus Moranbacteria bacterium GW2011_GWE2_47_10]KKW05742.1 MAG: hypothetical protein UY41_C0041G0002 [Candidatus Moranbacteria bacterium GW2011_GWE1_49_15]